MDLFWCIFFSLVIFHSLPICINVCIQIVISRSQNDKQLYFEKLIKEIITRQREKRNTKAVLIHSTMLNWYFVQIELPTKIIIDKPINFTKIYFLLRCFFLCLRQRQRRLNNNPSQITASDAKWRKKERKCMQHSKHFYKEMKRIKGPQEHRINIVQLNFTELHNRNTNTHTINSCASNKFPYVKKVAQRKILRSKTIEWKTVDVFITFLHRPPEKKRELFDLFGNIFSAKKKIVFFS